MALHPAIELQRQVVRDAQRTLDRQIQRTQKVCKHKEVVECNYVPSNYGSAMPPMRMCCNCGMTEDGWHCGFIVLTGDAKWADRDEIYAQRAGLFVSNEDKGPLLRKETTISKLVDEHFKTKGE